MRKRSTQGSSLCDFGTAFNYACIHIHAWIFVFKIIIALCIKESIGKKVGTGAALPAMVVGLALPCLLWHSPSPATVSPYY